MKEKLLFNAASAPEAGMAEEILKGAGIPCYLKTPGAGELYMAAVNMGVKVYVSEEDFERASELIKELSEPAQFIDFPEGDDYKE